MNVKTAVGIINCNKDRETGKELTHGEVYGRVIEYLGGLEAVAAYIPFDINDIRKALAKGDTHLNTLSIKTWDRMAGFYRHHEHSVIISGSGSIWDLLLKKGITASSPAENVCILKEAARRLAKLPKDEADEIIKSSNMYYCIYRERKE